MSLRCTVNPYSALNWDTVERHKANLHTHTNQSDGQLYPDAVIDLYQHAGYTILALTDHDSRHGLQNRLQNIHHPARRQEDRRVPDPNNPDLTFPADYDYRNPDWDRVAFTEAQLQAIAAPTWPWSQWSRYRGEFAPHPETGVMPNGMLAIEGNELSNHGHISSYYSNAAMIKWHPAQAPPDISEQDLGTEHEALLQVGAKNGLACLNHPQTDPAQFGHYEELFAQHRCLIGMEVCQPWQHDATSLWDHLLTRFMPERPIWGLGADDFHGIIHFGFAWNIFLLDRLTRTEVKNALESGRFYFVKTNQLWHKNAGEPNPEFYRVRGKPPIINRLVLDEAAATISIDASGYDSIHWISQGREVAAGETLPYQKTLGLDKYVRAELRCEDEWGIKSWAYTNPLGFSR